jgi:hypothetical protein
MKVALLAAAVIAFSSGCVHRFPSTVALDDPALEREWRASLFVPPDSIRSQQRVVLSSGGSEIDFTVLVRARRPDELRVVGLTDLGGTLFHVSRENGGTRVIQGSRLLGDDFLAETLLQGLGPLFLGVEEDELRLVRTEYGSPALYGRLGSEDVLFARADPGVAPDRFETGAGGRALASVRVLAWNRDADGRILFPERFALGDAAGKVRLEFRVIDWESEAA